MQLDRAAETELARLLEGDVEKAELLECAAPAPPDLTTYVSWPERRDSSRERF
jgi:hypothetical protein